MYRRKTFYLQKISGFQELSPKEVNVFFNQKFTFDLGYGFLDTEINKNSINSTLIYKSIIAKKTFNPELGHFENIEQTIFYQVPFQLNNGEQYIQIYSGGFRLKQLLLVITYLNRKKITFCDTQIDMSKMISEIEEKKFAYGLFGLRIENFKLGSHLHGLFFAKTNNLSLAKELIGEYGNSINEISFEFMINSDIVLWQVSRTGKVIIKAEDDILDAQSTIATNMILRCIHA